MIDQPFRQWLSGLCGPVLSVYRRLNVHPNNLSLLGFAGACLSALCVTISAPYAAIFFWWGGRFFDGTDGLWARESGQSSGFGAYLDILLDMAAYSLMIPAFYMVYPDHGLLLMTILLMYVLCITSALALGAQEEAAGLNQRDNRGLRLGAGLAEGGETGIAYTLFLLLPDWFSVLACFWLLVLVVTVVSRTFLAMKLFKSIKN